MRGRADHLRGVVAEQDRHRDVALREAARRLAPPGAGGGRRKALRHGQQLHGPHALRRIEQDVALVVKQPRGQAEIAHQVLRRRHARVAKRQRGAVRHRRIRIQFAREVRGDAVVFLKALRRPQLLAAALLVLPLDHRVFEQVAPVEEELRAGRLRIGVQRPVDLPVLPRDAGNEVFHVAADVGADGLQRLEHPRPEPAQPRRVHADDVEIARPVQVAQQLMNDVVGIDLHGDVRPRRPGIVAGHVHQNLRGGAVQRRDAQLCGRGYGGRIPASEALARERFALRRGLPPLLDQPPDGLATQQPVVKLQLDEVILRQREHRGGRIDGQIIHGKERAGDAADHLRQLEAGDEHGLRRGARGEHGHRQRGILREAGPLVAAHVASGNRRRPFGKRPGDAALEGIHAAVRDERHAAVAHGALPHEPPAGLRVEAEEVAALCRAVPDVERVILRVDVLLPIVAGDDGDAVRRGGMHLPHQLPFPLQIAARDVQRGLVARLLRMVLEAGDKIGIGAVLQIGHDGGERVAAALPQAPGAEVDRIAELLRRVHDGADLLGAHVAVAVEHVGDRSVRYAGHPRDVPDCRHRFSPLSVFSIIEACPIPCQ